MIELAFSILAADFAHLADEIALATAGGGTIVHVDVMDGHFVPNITFGPPVVKAIRPLTQLPLDCHLMIEDPDKFIPDFAAAGADMVAVHVEVCRHLNRTLQLIADHGMKPAVVLNPATPVEAIAEVLPMVHHVLVMSVNPGFGGQKFLKRSVSRIAHLARLRRELGLNYRIEVDGGIAMTPSPRSSPPARTCWSPAQPSSSPAKPLKTLATSSRPPAPQPSPRRNAPPRTNRPPQLK